MNHTENPLSAFAKSAWLVGIITTLALIGLISWTAQRDDAARSLDELLADAHCPAAREPLERFVMSIASEADQGAPTLTCVYITADLGVRPKLRYERPFYVTAK